MSSASLQPAHALPDAHEAFAHALIGTAEQSFFAYVSVCGESDIAAAAGAVDAWFQASVSYRASVAGTVTVLLPEPLTRDLHAAFLGDVPEEPVSDGDLADFAGEFANILCGSYLTSQCPEVAVPLGAPVVTRIGAALASPWVGATTAVFAMLNDQPVALWYHSGAEGNR